MMDGDGFAVFSLLEALRAAWSDAELDARVQLSAVDQTQVLCDYHAWAIPCAELLAGNVHEIVDAATVPDVACLDFSPPNTTRSGGQPADDRFAAIMTSCGKILNEHPSAGLMVAVATSVDGFAEAKACEAAAAKVQLRTAKHDWAPGSSTWAVSLRGADAGELPCLSRYKTSCGTAARPGSW
jgi:hypothetical protein